MDLKPMLCRESVPFNFSATLELDLMVVGMLLVNGGEMSIAAGRM
jgi:hypothetical protein